MLPSPGRAFMTLSVSVLFVTPGLAAASDDAELPEALPVCASPQLISSEAPLDGGVPGLGSIAWSGSEFAAVYTKNVSGAAALFFRRYYADGSPASEPVQINTGFTTNLSPMLIRDAGGYALVWLARPGSYYDVYFMRMNSAGTPLAAPLKASFSGGTATVNAITPRVAASGADYLVVWVDGRTGNSDVYGTLITGAGAVNGIHHDIVLSGSAANTQSTPAVAWSPGFGRYLIVWEDNRTAPGKYELYRHSIMPDGTLLGGPTLLVSGPTGNAFSPDLVATGGDFGLAWQDSRDGNTEIYFARLLFDGARTGSEVRVTNDPGSAYFPRILWTGGEFHVYWNDNRTGGAPSCDLFVQRVSPSGALSGANTQVTTGSSVYWGNPPGAAYARSGALLSFQPYSNACGCLGGAQLVAVGCSNVASYPTCPDNPLAYNVSGGQATVSWLPARDTVYDIAYYELLRDNSPVGRTAAGAFTDAGLGPSTTYNYTVRAVNAWGGASAGCPSIYVQTSASLTLTLDKRSPDAGLTWTPIGLNSYNVFRGTSPQIMQKIGATPATSTTDPNALANAVSYFYTVDDPGR